MKVKCEDRLKQKVITTDTLVVGVDIVKNYQWARIVDFRSIEYDHAQKFKNSRGGFETILVIPKVGLSRILQKKPVTKAFLKEIFGITF